MTETIAPPPPPYIPDDDVESTAIESRPEYVHTDPTQFAQDLVSAGRVSPETVEAALVNADAMKPTARVEVRMPTDAFLTMISTDGTYRTVHDGQESQGGRQSLDKNRYTNNREATEERLGLDGHNVVYGYLGNTTETDTRTQALGYGRVALILKPDTAERSSFTLGDSMLDLWGDRRPMNFDTAVVAKELNDISKYTADDKKEHYVEAQIFGGVSVEDIDTVSFTSKTSDTESLRTFIEEFQEHTTDVGLIVRVPDQGLRLGNIELAHEFPDVQFVFCVGLSDGIRRPHHPSITAHSNEHVTDQGFADRRMEASQRAYANAKQRQSDIQVNTHRLWREKHPDTGYPPNISVVIEQYPGE